MITTVKEMLATKYAELQKLYNPVFWENAKYYAEAKKMPLPKYLYMGLEITVKDIKANGGYNGELWNEISQMHADKLLASNAYRQDPRVITKYWLTAKGFRAFNQDHSIC